MKTLKIAFAAAAMLALAATNTTFAQDSSLTAMVATKQKSITLDNMPNTVNTSAGVAAVISEKAKVNFAKEFKTVSGEKWGTSKEGFTAGFTKDDKKSTIYYDRKGNWEASLVQYPENKLSGDIRAAVHQEFKNYNITFVDEIMTSLSQGVATYLVHLENAKYLKVIRYKEGEIDEWEEYEKN